MTPIEASSVFATLVGLICNWRDERGRQSGDRFQDFMVWLTNHKFEALRERIFDSDELQRELNALLQEDFASFSTKLDKMSTTLGSVAQKIDSLAEIGGALGASSDALSDQAFAILKAFDRSGAPRMIFFDRPVCFGFLPGGKTMRVAEERFLEADIAALNRCGFVELVDHNGSGNPIFTITRAGARIAQTITDDVLPAGSNAEQ